MPAEDMNINIFPEWALNVTVDGVAEKICFPLSGQLFYLCFINSLLPYSVSIINTIVSQFDDVTAGINKTGC